MAATHEGQAHVDQQTTEDQNTRTHIGSQAAKRMIIVGTQAAAPSQRAGSPWVHLISQGV